MSFKTRPVLIIGKADSSDFVVLPISRITNSTKIDMDYDIPLNVEEFPLIKLTQKSYIRTHKQSIVNFVELSKEIVDFKKEYKNKYLEVLEKVNNFQSNMLKNAL